MTRSKGLSITVDINLNLPAPAQYTEKSFSRAASAILSLNDAELMGDHLLNVNWAAFGSRGYCHQLRKAFNILIGPAGLHLKRWKSLKIKFPNSKNLIQPVLDILAKHPMELSSLEVYNWGTEWTDGSYITVFGDLGRIERLCLSNFTSISTLGISPHILQHLDIHVDCAYANLRHLPKFLSLLTLTLHVDPQATNKSEPFSIRLPKLYTLTIYEYHKTMNSIQWELPLLNKLIFRANTTEIEIPSVSAREIQFISQGIGPLMLQTPRKQELIDKLLFRSPNLHTLTVSPLWRRAALLTIVQHHSNKRASLLKKLIIDKKYESTEIYLDGVEDLEELAKAT